MSDLPPGFVLDGQPKAPAGLPPGFVLDGAPAATPARTVGAAMAQPQRPPAWATQPPPAPNAEDRTSIEDPNFKPPAARAGTSSRFVASPPAAPARLSGIDVGKTISNIPKSAGEFANALVQPFLHPVDTAKSVGAILDGVGSKISRPGSLLRAGDPEPTPEQLKARGEREGAANAVGNFFAERYGSTEALKNTLETDPVGFAADLSTLLTGGSMLPVRGASVLGKVGAAVDPLTQTGNALKLGAKGVEIGASNALGLTTGAGTEAVRAAGRAGREGGETAAAFTDNMRGKVPVEDIVDTAKSALEGIRRERADAYKAGKADLSNDATILDFNNIDGIVAKASEIGEYRGRSGTGPAMSTEPKAVAITQEMTDSISAWKQLDPAEFHTPEGLDALKRRLGNIRDATPERSPERVAADRIYRAVRDEVAAQAPGYAKMMEDYAQSSERLKEVSRTFSLGERATGNTAVGKLQSATRDGANTNWRNRGELLNELAKHESTLPYAIGGQAMNTLIPRGLGARVGAMTAAPLNAFTLPLFSPRIVGETVYLGGKAVGGIDDVANALQIDAATLRAMGQASFQSGRTNALGAP